MDIDRNRKEKITPCRNDIKRSALRQEFKVGFITAVFHMERGLKDLKLMLSARINWFLTHDEELFFQPQPLL